MAVKYSVTAPGFTLFWSSNIGPEIDHYFTKQQIPKSSPTTVGLAVEESVSSLPISNSAKPPERFFN